MHGICTEEPAGYSDVKDPWRADRAISCPPLLLTGYVMTWSTSYITMLGIKGVICRNLFPLQDLAGPAVVSLLSELRSTNLNSFPTCLKRGLTRANAGLMQVFFVVHGLLRGYCLDMVVYFQN